MSKVAENKRTIQKAFQEYEKAIDEYIVKSLEDSAAELLVAVARNRTFTGFTGNTQTSYACGIYVKGKCRSIVMQENWTKPPVHVKIRYGEVVYLPNPYEGPARAVRGSAPLDPEFGLATSTRFLLEYKGCPKDGWGLVMTTGTEYSELLEIINGMDVLTGTAEESQAILEKNFKPMPAEWQ